VVAFELRGATDELLERLAPLVRSGKATADPPPWMIQVRSMSQTLMSVASPLARVLGRLLCETIEPGLRHRSDADRV